MMPIPEELTIAVKVWEMAQIVYEGPSWEGQPEARALVEQLAGSPECEASLVALLDHPSQLVVAYALETLNLMGSSVLTDLSASLLNRRDKITLKIGSFRYSMDLGGLARQFQKAARRPS